MIEKYGADALRASMIIGSTAGNDIRLYEEKIAGYRNFVNKLWNISRYILSSVKEIKITKFEDLRSETLADEWILSEFNQIVKSTTKNLEEFKFSQAGEELYEFTWSKLADWYLEIAKIEGNKDEILLYILEKLLVLWHPFCPYVTEVLWEQFKSDDLMMVKVWPEKSRVKDQRSKIKDFVLIQDIISAIRNARSEHKANPKKVFICSIVSKQQKLIEENKDVIEGLAKIRITPKSPGIKLSVNSADVTLDIMVNKDVVKNKEKEIKNIERYINIQEAKLNNKEFSKKAPEEVILTEKEKLKSAKEKLEKLKE